jgi:RHS repeat-associated protein
VFSRWYTSDSLARITERGGSGAKFQRFVYDATDRLNGWYKKTKTNQPACTDGGPYGYTCSGTLSTTDTVWAMGYDKVGNPTDLSGTVDPGNRLRTYNGFTMTYDDDGNLLSKSAGGMTDTYDWDDFGQLKWVKRNGVLRASFDYDGFGRRIRKASATYGVIRYIWDGMQITAEADSTGNVTQTYAYYPGIDQLHSVTNASGQTYIASSEPLGDVNGLIRSSDNAIVARYAYRPWGELETDSVMVAGARLNSLRWRGLPYDAETGLYHMRARYYDPQTRRFISEDPIGLDGGINEYAFGAGDPVNASDPSGTTARAMELRFPPLSPMLWDDLFAYFSSGGGGGAGNPGERSKRGKDEPRVNARHDHCEVAGILKNYIDVLAQRGMIGMRPGAGYPQELDFKYQTPNDLYEVNGQWLRADQFGNFAAGYSAEARWGDVGWIAMRVGGIYYANSRNAQGKRDSGEHWSDLESAPMIDAGAQRAYADATIGGSVGARGGLIRTGTRPPPLTSRAGCTSN